MKFEQWLEQYKHRLELIRTIVPCAVLVMQIFIFLKLFSHIG